MKVLVIGAGAIGQVFGYSFAMGGAAVTFLTRPKYAAAARAGFVLYPMNRGSSSRHTPVRFSEFSVATDQDEAMKEAWDVIVIALSSVALRSGDWFDRLCSSLGDAQLLSLLAGSDDPPYILERLPAEKVSWGMLAVISFQAPLPGQELPEAGIAFWFPWLSKLGFSGSNLEFLPVLRRGGMPVAAIDSVQRDVAFTGAILDKTIYALEASGWTFSGLIADRELFSLAVAAMHESWTLATAVHGVKRPFALGLIWPMHLRMILRLAPWIMPFDLERFFHFHYQKVGEQQLLHLRTQVEMCAENGVDNPAMRELLDRLERARA